MGEVILDRQGAVAVLTIAAPDVRNALTSEMNQRIIELCAEVDADADIGAVVVRGAGGTFCSGSDTRSWGESGRDPAGEDSQQRLTVVYSMLQRIGSLQVPVVAAVRGAAVGAGLNLALAADIRVMATTARLRSGFVQAGLHPGGGFFVLAGRSAGRELTAALGIFGREVSGTEALAYGLALEAVEDGRVEQVALDYATRAGRDPGLTRAITQSYRTQLGPPMVPWPVAIEADRGRQAWSHGRRAAARRAEQQA